MFERLHEWQAALAALNPRGMLGEVALQHNGVFVRVVKKFAAADVHLTLGEIEAAAHFDLVLNRISYLADQVEKAT